MTTKKTEPTAGDEKTHTRNVNDVALEVGEGAIGAIAGAALGAIAGPPGVVIGAILGGAVGAVAGRTESNVEHAKDDIDQELDEEIGVTSGDIGAPNLKHPPTKGQEFYARSQKPVPPAKT